MEVKELLDYKIRISLEKISTKEVKHTISVNYAKAVLNGYLNDTDFFNNMIKTMVKDEIVNFDKGNEGN